MKMKKVFILLSSIVTLLGASISQAQTFSMFKDTVAFTYSNSVGGIQDVFDRISVPASGSPVVLNWKVIACNFPADWLSSGGPGVCDNNSCYSFAGPTGLWPAAITKQSLAYAAGTTSGLFDLQINLGTGTHTGGTYYVTARLTDTATGAYTTTATFAVTYTPPTEVATVKSNNEISLYPNPATSEVNVVFDPSADVKTIAVYNIIGKAMSVYRVNGNSANLSLENIPAGIYFVRLVNSQGEVVVTRKFTKQ